jgi:hypothetical protein
MARAFIGGVEYRVRVDRDLGESWAVSIVRPEAGRVPIDWQTLVVKLQGNDRAAVLKGGLEIMQRSGQIERFELDPGDEPPAAEPAAPAPAAAAPAPAAPAPAAPKKPSAA